MVYDWEGIRTRRIRLYKTGTVFLLGLALLGASILLFASRFLEVYG